MNVTLRRWTYRLLRILGLLVLAWLLASFVVTYRLTQRLERQRSEPLPTIPGLVFQEVRLSTQDGEELGAWFLPQLGTKPVVVLIHGNGDTRRGMLSTAQLFADQGYPTLLLTVRAHGDSTGETNDFGYSARFDVLAAQDWLKEHHPERGQIVWGRSLGSAAVLFAAQERPTPLVGCILECPYRDLATATRNRTRLYLPPAVEFLAYLGLRVAGAVLLPDWPKIAPIEAARTLPAECPVLILAGGRDRQATPAEAEQIRDVLGPRAELVLFPNAGHVQLQSSNPAFFHQTVLTFLSRLSH